jgi:hypothetical protein
VSVPLPQIASGDNRVLGAALAAYQREAAIVDPRLSRSVRLAAKATAFLGTVPAAVGPDGHLAHGEPKRCR